MMFIFLHFIMRKCRYFCLFFVYATDYEEVREKVKLKIKGNLACPRIHTSKAKRGFGF